MFLSAINVVKTPNPKTNDDVKGKAKIENGNSSFVNNGKAHAAESESWPHKHRPQSMDEIIGNQSIVMPFELNLLTMIQFVQLNLNLLLYSLRSTGFISA